jgi:hypothetical protein
MLYSWLFTADTALRCGARECYHLRGSRHRAQIDSANVTNVAPPTSKTFVLTPLHSQ